MADRLVIRQAATGHNISLENGEQGATKTDRMSVIVTGLKVETHAEVAVLCCTTHRQWGYQLMPSQRGKCVAHSVRGRETDYR
jgi:hypothetical protein